MNTTITALIEAAAERLAAAHPDLKLTATLTLTGLEAKRLRQSLDSALIPSLIDATVGARKDGLPVGAMMETLNEICGVSNTITDAGEDQPVTLDLKPARARALRQALRDVLIPAMDANRPRPSRPGYVEIIEGVDIIKDISARLEAEIDAVVQALRAKRDEVAAKIEDEEIAEIKSGLAA